MNTFNTIKIRAEKVDVVLTKQNSGHSLGEDRAEGILLEITMGSGVSDHTIPKRKGPHPKHGPYVVLPVEAEEVNPPT